MNRSYSSTIGYKFYIIFESHVIMYIYERMGTIINSSPWFIKGLFHVMGMEKGLRDDRGEAET